MHRLCLFLLLAVASGQPRVDRVENSASRIPASLPGGGLAAGAPVLVLGANFGADAARVRVRVGDVEARVVNVRDDSIELLWPKSTGALTVTVAGVVSRAFPIPLAGSAPGLFELAGPAQRGSLLALRGAGGLTSAATRIFVAGREARAVSRRTVAPGREEVTVQLPSDVPASCAVPVTAVGSNGLPGNTILAQVTERAAPCPASAWDQLFRRQGPSGLILLARSVQAGAVADDAVAFFLQRRQSTATLLPAPGSCALYRAADSFDLQSAIAPQIVGRLPDQSAEPALDAGPRLLLTRGSQARALNPRSAGFYTRTAGGAGEPAFLSPGSWMLSAPGGRGVPAFSVPLQSPTPFQAQLPEPGSVVSRASGFSLSWTPAGIPPLVVSVLYAPDRQNRAMAACVCTALSSAGRLEMPGWMLRAMPAGVQAGLALTALPDRPASFLPQVLENSAVFSVYVHATSVELR